MREPHRNSTSGGLAEVVALVVALIVVSPLSLSIASRADDPTTAPNSTETHFVLATERLALATAPARTVLRRVTTGVVRSWVATVLRLLNVIGLCALARRRYGGKQHERWCLPASHSESLLFLRGPPLVHAL